MRFALLATGAAAIVAVPMALSATGPQMSGDQFLSAVRCTAYEAAADPSAELGAVKLQLNSEAHRQPAEIAAQARTEAARIARQAVISESGANGSMLAQATCADLQMAGADAGDAA